MTRKAPRLLVLLLVPTAVGAGPVDDAGPLIFRLQDGSNYQEGCFDPCMCPIFMVDRLHGRFVFTPTTPENELAVYDVSHILWFMPRQDRLVMVRGSGVYRVGGEPLQQRLELDLTVDGEPRHMDSGWVPVTVEPPDLHIAVAENGFFCYDTAFEIDAKQLHYSLYRARRSLRLFAPSPGGSTTWGRLKGLYRP
jgi:hypothetical protein